MIFHKAFHQKTGIQVEPKPDNEVKNQASTLAHNDSANSPIDVEDDDDYDYLQEVY